ncbi:MAG: cell division protein FtsH, partial [Lachnospiraceae bacterium]|nr:cell division protein FtsH [Lachnospiraceae bacterium]
MKKQNYRGFGFYLALVAIVVIVWLMLDAKQNAANAYTMTEFKSALSAGSVVSVEVEQNREIPTGTLTIRLKDSSVKELFVSDVNEVQQIFEEEGFHNYFLRDVPQESWLLNLLPLLIVLASMFILFMIMSNQAAAGGGGSRMMNFGKSRAKLSTDANKMNFGNVAGLREEKEELEELVDFLRA